MMSLKSKKWKRWMEAQADVDTRLFFKEYEHIVDGIHDFATLIVSTKTKDNIMEFLRTDAADEEVKVKYINMDGNMAEAIIYRYDWQLRFYDFIHKQKSNYYGTIMRELLYGKSAKYIAEYSEQYIEELEEEDNNEQQKG